MMKTQEIASVMRESSIHPSAIVHSSAELGLGVSIGPFCVIGPDVVVGDGTTVDSHAVIEQWTTVGRNCQIGCGTVLGGTPQDHKFHGERSYLIIGDNNIIREYNTIHRGSGEESVTRIGSDNMLMAYCHVGHNCELRDNIVMANMVGISGHALIEDRVVFGGMVGVHQYIRIGRLAMIGGYSKVVQDIPPFMLADGNPAETRTVIIAHTMLSTARKRFGCLLRERGRVGPAGGDVRQVLAQGFVGAGGRPAAI